MAVYATVADVREALAPEGTSADAATAASLSDDQLTDALVEASSEIDGKVRGAPFADDAIPAVIQGIARDVAAYLATLTLMGNIVLPPEHPVALRYARAEALLTQAAAGTLDLTQDTEAEGAGIATAAAPYSGNLFELEDFDLGEAPSNAPFWNGGWGSGFGSGSL